MTPRAAHAPVRLEPKRATFVTVVLFGAAAVSFWTASRPLPPPDEPEPLDTVETAAKPTSVAAGPAATPPVFDLQLKAAATEERYVPRDPNEWQGMRVDRAGQPPCSAADSCGLALACIDGRCSACRDDRECAGGERCVLDHCLRSEQVECRTRSDCSDPEALCALSGYSGGDPRSNAELRSYCLPPRGVAPAASGASIRSGGPDDAARPDIPANAVSPQTLIDNVRRRSVERRSP